MNITETMRNKLLTYQRNEITEHHIYSKLAHKIKSPENKKVLADIADDELRHYRKWREYTRHDVEPDGLRIWKYYLINRIFGFTFGLKLMEKGEESAQASYGHLRETIPEADASYEMRASTRWPSWDFWMKKGCVTQDPWCWV
jgi:hypothetical protein